MLDNSLAEDKRNRSCVPNIVIILLCVELIVFISLVVFFDPKGTSSNLFYLFTLGYLLLWNIYFAWHSLVKENGFELSAFMLLTALLNFEGIYFVFTNPVPRTLRFFCLLYFILMYLANLAACYYCYMHFGKQYMRDLESVKDLLILKTVKEYEIFISNVKTSFIFTSLIVVSFTFYVILFWNSFIVFGVIISVLSFVVIVFHAGLGIWSSTKEKRRALISFMILIPVIQVVLLYMVIQMSLAPGEKLSQVLYDQSIILITASLICSFMLFYLARRNLKGFGNGRASIIKQTNDDFIKGMFIQLK